MIVSNFVHFVHYMYQRNGFLKMVIMTYIGNVVNAMFEFLFMNLNMA